MRYPRGNLTADAPLGDPRYGVKLDPGFTIYRDYKGKRYNVGRRAGSLVQQPRSKVLRHAQRTQQSLGIGGAENAWKAWYNTDESAGAVLFPSPAIRAPSSDGALEAFQWSS